MLHRKLNTKYEEILDLISDDLQHSNFHFVIKRTMPQYFNYTEKTCVEFVEFSLNYTKLERLEIKAYARKSKNNFSKKSYLQWWLNSGP